MHDSKVENSKQEIYLGDILDQSGNNKANFEKRKAEGYGITSEIIAIVNEISLAQWKIESS